MKSLVAFCASALVSIILHFTTDINNFILLALVAFFWPIIWMLIHILTCDNAVNPRGQVAAEYDYININNNNRKSNK